MSRFEKVTVSLSPEMARFVQTVVDAGEYRSADEAIGDAVRHWKEQRDLAGYTIAELRTLVEEGLASGPGRHGSIAAIKAEARRRKEARKD